MVQHAQIHGHHLTAMDHLLDSLQRLRTGTAICDESEFMLIQQYIKFHAGGYINHTLFWQNLRPPQPNNTTVENMSQAAPNLCRKIWDQWGSIDRFRKCFEKNALCLEGCGWIWLVRKARPGINEVASISVTLTLNQRIVSADETPILGIDLWEHAYHLQHLADKVEYLRKMWDVIDWAVAEKRFVSADPVSVFGQLDWFVTMARS